MTFDEAIAAVTDQPDLCLTGITLDRRGEWLTLYFLSSSADGPDEIKLASERLQLFTSHRTVTGYDLDSAPIEAMLIDYADHSEFFGRGGSGEDVLSALFPELPNPDETTLDEFQELTVRAAEASDYITIV
jgi:hypothetical protein